MKFIIIFFLKILIFNRTTITFLQTFRNVFIPYKNTLNEITAIKLKILFFLKIIKMNIETVASMLQMVYDSNPDYSIRKIRNPHKVMYKMYLEIPSDCSVRDSFKKEIDTISVDTMCTPPENWRSIWNLYTVSLEKHFADTEYEKSTWWTKMIDRFQRKEDDPDDYS